MALAHLSPQASALGSGQYGLGGPAAAAGRSPGTTTLYPTMSAATNGAVVPCTSYPSTLSSAMPIATTSYVVSNPHQKMPHPLTQRKRSLLAYSSQICTT